MDFRKRQKDYLSKLKSVQDRGPGGDVLGEVFEANDDDYDPVSVLMWSQAVSGEICARACRGLCCSALGRVAVGEMDPARGHCAFGL